MVLLFIAKGTNVATVEHKNLLGVGCQCQINTLKVLYERLWSSCAFARKIILTNISY